MLADSEARVHDDGLRMPVAVKQKAGRPKVNRYKWALERSKGRRPAGADSTSRQVYSCSKCGATPKKGHACPYKGK